MSSSLKLREAREDELNDLIKKAEERLPNSLTIHGILSIGFLRKIYKRDYSKIYVPSDEKLPFFIVITGIIIKKRLNMSPFWNPEEISRDTAKELLLSVPGWKWDEPFILYSVWIPTLLEIEKIVMGENGISNNKLKLSSHYGYCYTLDKNVFSPTIPESNFVLAPLKVDDAELVYENWIYKFAEDTESIRKNLECLPSIAAYDKVASPNSEINPNVKEEQENKGNNRESFILKPVSWALTRPYGEIGFNFTFPEYRSKGLSAAVTKEVAKKLLEEGITPSVNVTNHNPAAVKAVENIGFREYIPIGYHYYFLNDQKLSDL